MDVKKHVTGVQHIGIPTNKMDETVCFYQSLGFVTEYQTINEKADEKVAFLTLGNLTMEVYESKKAVMAVGAIDHVALDVTDIDQVFESVKQNGFTLLDDKVQSLAFWEHGVKFFTILGPNKEKIEFCEKLKS